MINLLSTRSNVVDIAYLFVKSLNVKISKSTLQKEIEEHPFYPSLLSITEVLNSFGIKNVTAKFDPDKILGIPVPSLVQMKVEGSKNNYFSVVRQIDEREIGYYSSDDNRWITEKTEVFISKCTGVVLMAEVQESAGEKNYLLQKKRDNSLLCFKYFIAFIFPLLIIFQGITGFIGAGSSVIIPLVFSILFFAGSLISFLLVWHEVDRFNPASQSICAASKKINCSTILNSKGGKIFGIKWSVLGLSYFLGGLVYLLTIGFYNLQSLSILWLLNSISMLYVVYSVYYQWKIARTWCPLCLSVQAILILISTVGFLGDIYNTIDFSFGQSVQLLTTFIIPFIATNTIYSIMLKNKDYKNGKLEFQRLKRNPENLNRNLMQQRAITEDLKGLGIVLGNRSSVNKIVKVCNPYCGPCAAVHDSIKELLNNNDDLAIQIIFTATNENNDIRALPVRHLLALYHETDVDIEQALEDWYHAEVKDYILFAEKYPLNSDLLLKQNQKIEMMREWANKTKISFTPTFFVNGHQLPREYAVTDLKYYFLD